MDPLTGITRRKKIKGTEKKGDSIKIAQEWLKNVQNGLLPDGNKVILKDWIDQYLKEYANDSVRIKSYAKYESCLKYVKESPLGNLTLGQLKSSDIQRFINKLLASGGKNGKNLSSSTVCGTRRYLSMALNQAVKAGLIQRNVASDTKPPKLVKEEIHPLDSEQITKLVDTSKQFGEVARMVIEIALNTGMRLGEIFGLKWDCVDLKNNKIYVRRQLVTGIKGAVFQEPKTKESKRKILLPGHLVAEMKNYKAWQDQHMIKLGNLYQDNNLVITNLIGKVYDTSNFTTRTFKKMLKEAHIEQHFKFHDLRHTHATMLLMDKIHPKVVQERLGHSTIKMTLDTYGHLMPDMQDSAVNSLEKLFGAEKNNKKEE